MKGEFMAKRKDTTTPSGQATPRSAAPATDTVEQRVVAFAEQLGRIVGTVQARADGWLDRQTLNDELTRIRDGAADLLHHLGSGTPSDPVAAATAPRRTTGDSPERSATTTTARRATARTGRSGGKVDAPGKSHRKPPPSTRGTKHSDEMIPKMRAAQMMRRSGRG
jgi:hypothetical protein